MDSYNFHFERMNNLDLHPLSLPVSRLSPAKSSSSIDQFTHHHHGKGDSAYSSFSGGSNAPDYPSPFLPDDLQPGSYHHYADLKYVKAIYNPGQALQSDARSMDQLYRSVEAISKQYRHGGDHNDNSSDGFLGKQYCNQDEPSRAPPPLPPPPPPARLDSYITTRNLENSRVHHGPEGQQGPQAQRQAQRGQTANPEAGCLRSDLVYAWQGSEPYHRDPLNPDNTDKSSEQQKSANILSRSPPRGTSQPEHPKHKQQTSGGGGGHFEADRKKVYVNHRSLLQESVSPWHVAQNLINSSIQHKGQFYFVTGVSSESGLRNVSPCVSEAGSGGSTVVEIHRLVEKEKERERLHSTPDNNPLRNPHQRHPTSPDSTTEELEHLTNTQSQDEEHSGSPNSLVSRSFDASEPSLKSQGRDRSRHNSSHPIFYCGPEDNSPPPSTLPNPSHIQEMAPPPVAEQPNQHTREDQGKKGRRHTAGDVASDRINKETTPLLYHLTGASRVALKPKKDSQASVTGSDRPQGEVPKEERGVVGSNPCNTLDDSFKKYYKEKLKDAQPKVLRETSFKRRDLQLSWPHRVRPRPELRPTVLHSDTSPQDSETSANTFPPPLAHAEGTERVAAREEVTEPERESVKEAKKENARPVNVAQPQVARIGGRKRLTQEQKKLCYSEPENLNQLGDGPSHAACRSLGNEREGLLSGQEEHGEQGLVAARRQMFETRGRALSASSISKSTLKHLQHTALVAYMERKTGQKVAEPQQPAPQVPTAPSQRHSTAGKPSDWCPRPQDSGSKCPKKTLQRPLSAGRILDSSSSSIRYAQFSSAQSSSGQSSSPSHLSSWRDKPSPPQGMSASVESLLDQPEAPEFFRNRSTSIPHIFQNPNRVNDPSPVNSVEISSLQRTAEEEVLPRPGQVPAAPPAAQRIRVTAPRGKSMEELGISQVTRPSVLSQSSEQLDLYQSRPSGPGQEKAFSRGEAEQTTQRPEKIHHGREHAQTQRKPLFKQHSAPQFCNEDKPLSVTRETRNSSRSTSPSSSASSRTRAHSDSPRWSGSGPAILADKATTGPPSEAAVPPTSRGQEPSENEVEASSPVPSNYHHHHRVPSESKPCPSRLRMTPSLTTEGREESVDEPSETPPPDTKQEVSLSCGVTTDPSLWIVLPEPGSSSTEDEEAPPLSDRAAEGESSLPAPAEQGSEPPTPSTPPAPDTDTCQSAEGEVEAEEEAEHHGVDAKEEREEESPEGEMENPEKTPAAEVPRWAELVEEVVTADQSLAQVLYPLTNRKTALMLMEQLLSEDTLLMEEHYKKKQEKKEAGDSSGTVDDVLPPPSSSPSPDKISQPEPKVQDQTDIPEKKRQLMARIEERLHGLEEGREALQLELEENGLRGRAVEALVQERCQPMEMERYTLFIGDLEKVVSLLLCLSARLARVQNALSTVDEHTDAEEKQSLDNRHRLLCKQRDDAKDLKDNLDRRENLVSSFLSRQLSSEQLLDYRRFVQTKASLLIRQKDLEERQRLGEEQLEALFNSLPP
ncbi:protein Shroom1 isoform X1 [Hypomesus transpacificus]|uniref:protein Shroom1 isoform X1 n=1 Tax=Hypomesus transpacificus TaxID=137520 RepID=UPI001F07C30F|nr:protein Shroom1 isoform X1 [Hypomesus transpacificus]XP_046876020.1 protein Shroom1 isoform X1 [Hypomesus transpacificus]